MIEIQIKDDIVSTKTPEGREVRMPLADFVHLAWPPALDTCGTNLPNGVRQARTRGALTILTIEYPPGLYSVRWIRPDSPRPYGPEATYANYRISLPYIVVLAAFEHGALCDYNECFFRNKPLAAEGDADELSYPALLNCSRFVPPDGRPLSWICTQKMDRSHRRHKNRSARMWGGLLALKECLFETGFNYSSEHHEHSSWYGESRALDPRLSSIDAWHEASRADPLFALDVPWLPTGKTVGQVVERIFANQNCQARGVTAKSLARIIANHSK